MPQTLVTTKLRAPRTRPNLVARPRLREALDRVEGRRLTLVSAPAGFGKTTLLAEWLRDNEEGQKSVAWVSLDGSDSDPARFLTYLVGALRGVDEGIGEGIPALLNSPGPVPIEAVVGALVNGLASVEREITIVLDDYHAIDSESVHEAVSFLIEQMPENARLVIAGRTDPPLPLPRLRARDQMTEIRAADLRFTPEEASAFLKDAMGLALSAEDVAALEEITEGWVAALQLAALSMRDREDVSGFVESFSGSNRHVLDFLAEEVLERQPEAVKEFLLRTSVLGRMSAPVCDALTGHDDGQEILEKLERENLFVVPLDDERVWYRYHHLFADFLRARLRHENLDRTDELHLRASGWYEDNGLIVEATEHATSGSGSDHERAARLVERGVKEAWIRGEFPTVLRWVGALPAEAKRRRPRLLLQHALALALIGRPDEAEPLVKEAEQAAEATGKTSPFLLGFASAIRSWRARLQGDAPRAAELARRALSLMPEEEGRLRNFAAVCLGDTLWTTGDVAAASEAFAEAAEIGRAAGHVYGMLTGMAWHARAQAERGLLREADATLHQARRFVTEQGVESLPAAGSIHIGLGALLYERDDLYEAERELDRGLDLAEQAREVSNLTWGYVTLSRARRAQGDEEGALEIARKADRIARGSGADAETAIAAAWMARLHLARGDLAGATALEQERVANNDAAPGASRMVDRLTSARLLHARGRPDKALRLLEGLQAVAEGAGRTGNLLEILTLQTLALWANNEKERAVKSLARALSLAEPEGYVRTFADEENAMGDLLSATLEVRRGKHAGATDQVSAAYLARLQAALARGRARAGVAGRLSEPPSARELEVLALVAAGASNAEIAGKLFVSTSTVKTHINNLYRKLEARSRIQAVARARELGLL